MISMISCELMYFRYFCEICAEEEKHDHRAQKISSLIVKEEMKWKGIEIIYNKIMDNAIQKY